MVVEFPIGSMDGVEMCGSIMITDDTVFEGDETFTVTLTSSDATVVDSETMVTITDDEGQLCTSIIVSNLALAPQSLLNSYLLLSLFSYHAVR